MTTLSLPDEETCWRAIRARDASMNGRFLTGVLTTGVYCKPSCPARPPKPENVRFFATAEAAEAAGLRACKRCRPKEDGAKHEALIRKLAAEIEADPEAPAALTALAARTGLSPAHLQKVFKAIIGVSPKELQAAARLKRAKAGLRAGEGVVEAIFDAGFGSTRSLYEQVDGRLGMTPTAYRAGGAGETIAYAMAPTPLGLVGMGATARGVCFVQFGDSEETLLAELQAEFPKATLTPAPRSSELELWLAALVQHLKREGPRPDAPLDLRGTAFQLKVWRFLLSIPEGEVRSYAEVAAGIGAPNAVRAVGTACGANRIAVLAPCHRVLRGDGSLGGYRYGLDRKRALLAAERKR